MKRNKLILFGSIGVVAAAAVLIAQPFSVNEKGSYKKTNLSFLKDQSSEDARIWLDARYIDPETGQKMSDEKLRQIEKAIANANVDKAVNLTWREEGPDNIGGRTRAILIDRNNINRIWAGSVSGGLFVSTNRANGWSKVEEYPGSKFISSMTQTANGTIFVATGSNNEGWSGDGVHYSTDLGVTWDVVPGTSGLSRVTEVANAPNSNTVYMATSSGLKKYTVGDASLTDVATTSGIASAVQVSVDGQVIVAAVGSQRTFVSTDGGANFTDRSGQASDNKIPLGSPRIEYAISPTKNSSNKYSIYASRTNSNLMSMHVSHDNGETWSQFIGASGNNSNLNIYRDQGTYNSILSVRPDDPTSIMIGGIDIWKWKQQVSNPVSGGFEQISQWFLNPTNSKYVHADNHEMKWDSQNRLYVGNDGGINLTHDYGITWNTANRGYNVTQFYGIAHDRDGAVMGGTQDNGTLYNNHTGTTYQEFATVGGGDGFECEISFFNPNVKFQSVYYNSIARTIVGGGGEPFNPPYPASYGTTGEGGGVFPFHTELYLAEYYDLDSKDSVLFVPTKDYAANTSLRVSSRSTGDSMSIVTPIALYYDDTVNYDPALTEDRIFVFDQPTGAKILLGNYNYTPFPTASGQTPPQVGDSLLVDFPSGQDTIVVASTGTYTWYQATNPNSGKVIDLGLDSVKYAVSWDSLTVQDPYQSWYVVYTGANGGEIWGTRDALRFSELNPKWVLLVKGIGTNGGFDVEFTKDLSTMFVASGNKITRLSGLDVYTSEPNFSSRVGYQGVLYDVAPTGTSAQTIYNGSVEGIAINPNNPNDLLVMPGFAALKRSNNAMSGTPTFTTLSPMVSGSNPGSMDGIIDRDDSDILVVGTMSGVFTSDDGGASWSYNSEGFEGTPVFEVRQNWRTFAEGNNRPGEIYIGTFGRGIWASSTLLGLDENNGGTSEKVFKSKLKMYPNPVSSSTTLEYNLTSSSNVVVNVYSITGALVKTINLKNVSKGAHTLNIDATNFTTGTYIVKMTAGNQSESVKFIKM